MIWERMGTHGMQSEAYRIAKCQVFDKIRYGLFYLHEKIGYFDSAEDAKVEAEKHAYWMPLPDAPDE